MPTLDHISHPWMQTLVAVAAVLAVAVAANWITKKIVLRLFLRLLSHIPLIFESGLPATIVARLSNIVPALVIQFGIGLVPNLPAWSATLVRNVSAAFVILTIAIALSLALGLFNELYQRRPHAANRPIKGYVQVGKLIVYLVGAILIIATLIDRSPLLLMSGLGAMAAVLMLVFKDTILSLVASVQIGSNDMVRVGDWIEMPQLNANGDVIDIALHTVKIQNFDKTITTIPTHRLITESFKNWRGMAESGARRIMRAIVLDQNSVKFLSGEEADRLADIALIGPYLEEKRREISRWELVDGGPGPEDVNARRITNIGTFRAYTLAYLKSLDAIDHDMTVMVRQLEPGENGLPLEIYAFAATTDWGAYENIQADIFDHLLAVLPAFGLRLFQRPTGLDIVSLLDAQPNHRGLAAA